MYECVCVYVRVRMCVYIFFKLEMTSCLFFLIYLFILAALGLCCCAQAFSSRGERGLLFVAMHGLLTAEASLVAGHGL